MKSSLALAVFAATLAFAGAIRAQEPQQQPAEEETPSMTSDDAAAPLSTSPSATGQSGIVSSRVLENFYGQLVRQGVSAADVASIRRRIDGGGELTTGVRFDVGSDGEVLRPAVERSSGFPSLDDTLTREFSKNPGEMQIISGFTGVRILIGMSRRGIHLVASGTAPTVDRAASLESIATELRERAPRPDDVSIRRNGATLNFELMQPFEDAPK